MSFDAAGASGEREVQQRQLANQAGKRCSVDA